MIPAQIPVLIKKKTAIYGILGIALILFYGLFFEADLHFFAVIILFSGLISCGYYFLHPLKILSSTPKQILFLFHFLIATLLLFIAIYLAQGLISGTWYTDGLNFLMSFNLSKVLFGITITQAIVYLAFIFLSMNMRTSQVDFYRQGSFVAILISIFFIYGAQDRFVFIESPLEDLQDFLLIQFEVVIIWSLINQVFSFIQKRFGTLRPNALAFIRGILLILVCIPLDVVLNWAFLKVFYGSALYADYWVLDLPLKMMILLFINFLYQIRPNTAGPGFNKLKVKIGNHYKFIPFEDIGYVTLDNKINYLVTMDHKKFVVDQPLTKLEEILGRSGFFRASRQLLLSRKAVKSYQTIDGKKLTVNLIEANNFPIKNHQISRLTAPKFKRWMKNGDTIQGHK